MSSALPSSLSPHICILPSNDLSELLSSSSLPSLPHILQSFSPLPQVTTRTTSLVSVPHTSFALRFSDLAEIESGCREDEEQRAVRTLDWIGARIHKRCTKWMEDIEKNGDQDNVRTPWWDELRRCAEGDHIPSKTEAWNHPVAVILAVSTTAPNPLQAITALHSRSLDLPPWVDRNILRYTLIVHPENSPLSNEEAGALFNAVKKQFGLHSYLLSMALSMPPPPPVPVPALIPRLPPPPAPESSLAPMPIPIPTSPGLPSHPNGFNTLRLSEKDIQQTARFTREFLVMSLLPWMEKCVVDWNENFSSTRRLPSRLFSSTRRLFGSPSPSPSPVAGHNPSSSVSSLPARAPLHASIEGPDTTPPPQLRRLAEFATILGDGKLAVSVWEALRKEGKGGSDILPLLLSPSPTLALHAFNALSSINLQTSEPRAHEQLSALKYAVRWEAGIRNSDFVNYPLEGERWLVWAAGNAEEPAAGLLLGHAALLSSRKWARRRAALWYLTAANRLEKCGIKPLTMYFLRRAHDLYKNRPQKSLSPSFWESEGTSPFDVQSIDAIMLGIEHPLGRLLYTTGDVAAAVRFFLGLLRRPPGSLSSRAPPSANGAVTEGGKITSDDKMFLDDFRVAFAHFKSTSGDDMQLTDLKLPFKFCLQRQTHARLLGDSRDKTGAVWETREEQWKAFRKSRGQKDILLHSGKAPVNGKTSTEVFWVDLVLVNPLDTEINLSNVTVVVQEPGVTGPSSATFVEVESIDDITLAANESRTVSIRVKSNRAATLRINHATYDFLSLLPNTESLASRGRRLHDTALQLQNPTYSADTTISVNVEEVNHRLLVDFVDDQRLVLAHGERKPVRLWFSNTGKKPIKEVWMVSGPENLIWVGEGEDTQSTDDTEIIRSPNSLQPGKPHRLTLSGTGDKSSLNPGDSVELSALLYADSTGDQEVSLLFVYREDEEDAFQSARVSRNYEVHKLFETSVVVRPCQSLNHLYLVDLEIGNLSSSQKVQLTQVSSLSATWKCDPIAEHELGSLSSSQSSHLLFGASRWNAGSGTEKTLEFVSRKLSDVLQGKTAEISDPPPIDLLCSHISDVSEDTQALHTPSIGFLLSHGRRKLISGAMAHAHPYIPSQSHPYIFPLYNPASVDFIIFWEIPSQQRSGHLLVSGLTLGARHGALGQIIEEAEGTKIKRSMYAETQREKEGILDAIRGSEWNAEMNPLVLVAQEPPTLTHNFEKGPCRTPVTLTLRNYSSTHRSRYVLKLNANTSIYHQTPNIISPPYTGRLTFRGILDPSKTITIRPALWITRPGTYGLGGWSVEVEVLETLLIAPDSKDARIRHRYRQESSPEDRSCFVVCANP